MPATESPSELNAVLAELRPGLVAFGRLLTGDASGAEDLVHEAMASLLGGNFSYQGRLQTAKYLRTAMYRLAQRRRHRALPTLEDAEAVMDRWQPFQLEGPGHAALADCLKHVSDREREALRLRYANDLSEEEVAALMGLKPAGVHTLLQRTRDRLRACMESKLKPSSDDVSRGEQRP